MVSFFMFAFFSICACIYYVVFAFVLFRLCRNNIILQDQYSHCTLRIFQYFRVTVHRYRVRCSSCLAVTK